MTADHLYTYDVFISYSHHDEEWVEEALLPRLEAAGLKVCIDFRDFRLGAPSVMEMERAVLDSHRTVLVLTPNYVQSQWADVRERDATDPGAPQPGIPADPDPQGAHRHPAPPPDLHLRRLHPAQPRGQGLDATPHRPRRPSRRPHPTPRSPAASPAAEKRSQQQPPPSTVFDNRGMQVQGGMKQVAGDSYEGSAHAEGPGSSAIVFNRGQESGDHLQTRIRPSALQAERQANLASLRLLLARLEHERDTGDPSRRPYLQGDIDQAEQRIRGTRRRTGV